MKSTIGRPRMLTDRQVRIILAWHVRFLLWRAWRRRLKSQRQLARELGVSQATVSYVLRIHGRYKKAEPEGSAAEVQRRKRRLARQRSRPHLES